MTNYVETKQTQGVCLEVTNNNGLIIYNRFIVY